MGIARQACGAWRKGRAVIVSSRIWWQDRQALERRVTAPALSVRRSLSLNSPSRARTCDLAVNSRSLYQLSYRGIRPKSEAAKHRLAVTTAVSVKNQISISLSRFIWGCRYRKIAPAMDRGTPVK
jgi:hypothetical protein